MSNKNFYFAAIGVGAAIVTSISSAVYTYVTTKKYREFDKLMEKKGEDIMKAAEANYCDLKDRLEKKVNGISENLNIDVPDEVVETAFKKAADAEAATSIRRMSADILAEYKGDIRAEVRKSVDLAYENTKLDVKRELTRQITNVDISGIKRDIIEEAKRKIADELDDAIETIKSTFEDELDEAKEKATEKFEEELDSISTRFNNDLERGSKIYKVLSDKLSGD